MDDDAVYEVLRHLSPIDLVRCRLVSKQFKRVADFIITRDYSTGAIVECEDEMKNCFAIATLHGITLGDKIYHPMIQSTSELSKRQYYIRSNDVCDNIHHLYSKLDYIKCDLSNTPLQQFTCYNANYDYYLPYTLQSLRIDIRDGFYVQVYGNLSNLRELLIATPRIRCFPWKTLTKLHTVCIRIAKTDDYSWLNRCPIKDLTLETDLRTLKLPSLTLHKFKSFSAMDLHLGDCSEMQVFTCKNARIVSGIDSLLTSTSLRDLSVRCDLTDIVIKAPNLSHVNILCTQANSLTIDANALVDVNIYGNVDNVTINASSLRFLYVRTRVKTFKTNVTEIETSLTENMILNNVRVNTMTLGRIGTIEYNQDYDMSSVCVIPDGVEKLYTTYFGCNKIIGNAELKLVAPQFGRYNCMDLSRSKFLTDVKLHSISIDALILPHFRVKISCTMGHIVHIENIMVDGEVFTVNEYILRHEQEVPAPPAPLFTVRAVPNEINEVETPSRRFLQRLSINHDATFHD